MKHIKHYLTSLKLSGKLITSTKEPPKIDGIVWFNPTTNQMKKFKHGQGWLDVPFGQGGSASGDSNFYIGDTPPSNPSENMIWIDTTNPNLHIAKRFNGVDWELYRPLSPDVYVGDVEPPVTYDGLIWLDYAHNRAKVFKDNLGWKDSLLLKPEPPVIDSVTFDSESIYEGLPVNMTINAHDPQEWTLNFDIQHMIDGLTITQDETQNNKFTLKFPYTGENKTYTLKIVASNGVNESYKYVTVNVLKEEKPVIDSINWDDNDLVFGETYTVTINAHDPDGTIQSYEIICDDPTCDIQQTEQPNVFKISFNPTDTNLKNKDYTITYRVSDGIVPVEFTETKTVYKCLGYVVYGNVKFYGNAIHGPIMEVGVIDENDKRQRVLAKFDENSYLFKDFKKYTEHDVDFSTYQCGRYYLVQYHTMVSYVTCFDENYNILFTKHLNFSSPDFKYVRVYGLMESPNPDELILLIRYKTSNKKSTFGLARADKDFTTVENFTYAPNVVYVYPRIMGIYKWYDNNYYIAIKAKDNNKDNQRLLIKFDPNTLHTQVDYNSLKTCIASISDSAETAHRFPLDFRIKALLNTYNYFAYGDYYEVGYIGDFKVHGYDQSPPGSVYTHKVILTGIPITEDNKNTCKFMLMGQYYGDKQIFHILHTQQCSSNIGHTIHDVWKCKFTESDDDEYMTVTTGSHCFYNETYDRCLISFRPTNSKTFVGKWSEVKQPGFHAFCDILEIEHTNESIDDKPVTFHKYGYDVSDKFDDGCFDTEDANVTCSISNSSEHLITFEDINVKRVDYWYKMKAL